MLSLNDLFNEEELYDWENRIKKLIGFTQGNPVDHRVPLCEYFCEVKFDGLAVSLIYEDGKFVRVLPEGMDLSVKI